jgi:hypothetical protein
MEAKTDGHIPFLDINVYERPSDSLGHRVCRMCNHINLYLNAISHYHPAKKEVVFFTLVHRAKSVCDSDSLPQELKFLQETIRNNGYSERQILCDLNPPTTATPPCRQDLTLVVFLPFISTTITSSVGRYPNTTL